MTANYYMAIMPTNIGEINNNNNNLPFIHTLYNFTVIFTSSQRCEPCHLYELSQHPSLDTTSSTGF